MNIVILKGARIVSTVESQALRLKAFQEIRDRHWKIRWAERSWFFCRRHVPALASLMVAFYGCLGFRVKPSGAAPILSVATFANEVRQIEEVRNCLEVGSVATVSFPLTQLLRPATLLRMCRGTVQYLRIVNQICSRYDFMPACRTARYLGCHFAFRHILRESDYQAVIVASTYSPEAVALRLAAAAIGLRAAYVSHGRLGRTQMRPDLGFDLVFLSGQDEIADYQGLVLSSGRVCLMGFAGDSRPMNFAGLSDKGMSVGIFLTAPLDRDGLERTIAAVQQRFAPARIIVRQHPVELVRTNLADLPSRYAGLEITAGTPMADDLARCDLVIASNSNAHLETLRAGVPTVYVAALDKLGFDLKNFVEKRIVFAPGPIDTLDLEDVERFYDAEWAARFKDQDASYGRSHAESAAIVRQEMMRLLARR